MRVKILLIEDDGNFANAVRLILREQPVDVVWAKTGAEGIQLYRKSPHEFATVIIDYCLPDLKGSEVGLTIKKLNRDQDILFASGFNEPANLIDLLETGGGRSFLYKGRPPQEISARILDSISIYRNQTRLVGTGADAPGHIESELRADGFVGRSSRMHEVLRQIRKFRSEPFSTLIVGESGTGKELVARSLTPSGKEMIVVDCPRYSKSENLLESDLFGHVKGAFTGADRDKPGLLAQAHGQVVFFDEFHQLSMDAQTKLLRFLQEMKVRRVGDPSGREITVQFRVITAAKPEIYERIKDGSFLEDLFHRVSRLEIRVPALRERFEDLEPLVRHIQDEINAGRPPGQRKQIRISTVTEMSKHPWTGNVRELQNAVTRLMTTVEGDIINPEHFREFILKTNSESFSPQIPLGHMAESLERNALVSALERSQTKTEAALILGITRWSLNRALERLDITPEHHLMPMTRRESAC